MKKIILFLSLVIFLIIAVPTGVVGFESLKSKPSLNKDTPNKEIVKKETVAKADNSENDNAKEKVENKNINIKVYNAETKKIVTLPIEEYIKSVVASEMPMSFHDEALKAQSIAARSFVVPKLKEAGGTGCPKAHGADVCSDVHCQAFTEKDKLLKSWGDEKDAKWEKVSKAVESTKGQVLTHNGQIADAIKYFSTSTGKTEDSSEVFGYDKPYLKSVESKGEEVAPNFKSQVTIKKKDFISKVKKKHKDVKLDVKKLDKQIKITEKTTGDRVKAISIGGKTLTGIEVRSLFDLKSADFKISFDKNNIIFNVQGYGHGVGMSQWGANEMGKSNKNYKEILTHYYSGIEIEDYNKYIK